MFEQLAGLPHVPNEKKSKRSKEAHWYPVSDAVTKTMRPPRVFVEQIIQYIYSDAFLHVFSTAIRCIPKQNAEPYTTMHVGGTLHAHPVDLHNLVGVEWWVHSRRLTDKMHFHFDRDEILWEDENVMVHPDVSSIFYLTDTGGATLIVDQRYDSNTKGLAPPLPERGF
eukprot:8156292-Pyramimonas_sp.AAC.1